MVGVGQAPGLGEGYDGGEGDGRHGISGIRWGVEWSAGYELRPARWGQRWSWQNRGGYVDESEALLSEDADPNEGALTEVPRLDVEAALAVWAKKTGSPRLGQSYSVNRPEDVAALSAWLIAGPVGAVLESLGYSIVE